MRTDTVTLGDVESLTNRLVDLCVGRHCDEARTTADVPLHALDALRFVLQACEPDVWDGSDAAHDAFVSLTKALVAESNPDPEY
jgi:hypothetical protein